MKKYLIATLLAFCLTGCRNMNEMKQDAYDMGQDAKDEMNDMGEDIKEYGKDMKEDIKDYDEDMREDFKDESYKQTQPTSNVYGLNLDELWLVPSFCNATIGTKLFRGY